MQNFVKTIDFRELLRRRCYDIGIKEKELRERTGFSQRTFFRRMKNPGELTVSELSCIASVAMLTDEDIIQVVRAKSRTRK